jgi:hypothetical protein
MFFAKILIFTSHCLGEYEVSTGNAVTGFFSDALDIR